MKTEQSQTKVVAPLLFIVKTDGNVVVPAIYMARKVPKPGSA
jgi:hypothetical protein